MIIFTLNATHQPANSVPKFESFVWVERYQAAGDFQLVVENDKRILTLLPLGSLISHTDTKEVMIVENHEIDRDAKKTLKVTVSGRSFETFSENRNSSTSSSPIHDPTTLIKNPDLTITAEPWSVIQQLLKASLEPGTASANDQIANLLVRSVIRVAETSMTYVIKRGDIYSRVLEYLSNGNLGIKILRPNGAQTTMDVVIHDGLDKSLSVIFYSMNEDLTDAKYFWSLKDYKNYAQISTHTSARLHRTRDLLADVTGLLRRTLYVEEDGILGDFAVPVTTDLVGSWAQLNLDNKKQYILMQATISKTAKPKFKFDYDIGDLVTVFGEFTPTQIMRVTEHILTVDKDGMRGFPSLSIA